MQIIKEILKQYSQFNFMFSFLKNKNFSNVLSDKRLRRSTFICCAKLKRRSTGADDGRDVLYLRKIFLTFGKFIRNWSSFDLDSKYESASILILIIVCLFSLFFNIAEEVFLCATSRNWSVYECNDICPV